MQRSRRRAVATVSAGLGLLLLLSAADSPTPLSAGQATKVVVQFYRSNLKANDSLDTALLNTLEEGVSATMDDRGYALLAEAGETSESAPPIPTKSEVSVSISSSQASDFLALIKWPAVTGATPRPAATEYLLFRKDSKSKPWRVLYESGAAAGIALPRLSANSAAIRRAGSASEFADLAKYYNGGDERFAAGPLSSKSVALTKQNIATALSNGITYTNSYTVASSPITTVAASSGTLEFGTLAETDESVPSQTGNCTDTNSTDNNEMLALAPSGVPYASVTANYLLQVVIFVPENHHQLPQVLGDSLQIMSVSAPAC